VLGCEQTDARTSLWYLDAFAGETWTAERTPIWG